MSLPPRTDAPLHNLPTPPTPFIGRDKELAEIKQLLLEEPACRLLTLVGPGGIGKTRLSIEAASAAINAFPHGVYFVSLSSVTDPQFIGPAIAEALNINFPGQTDPTTQLLNYLRQKKLLLVVDNMEHLLIPSGSAAKNEMTEGEALLVEILNVAGQVKLLVTSRERLNLQEEWSYEVRGLPFPLALKPSSVDSLQSLQSYSAVQLFAERARRARANFSLSTGDASHVILICQLVNGMPLGLELAASWVRTMTCEEIAHEITHNLDFLATSMRNVPARHRSLRAIIQQTWQRLPDAEKSVLSKISVFQGGCLRDAAEAVTGATLPLLSSLVDKALLRRTHLGRYDMHELIRQFASEQLQAVPDHYEQTHNHHCNYYALFHQKQVSKFKDGQQKKALAEIASDIDNMRAAWHWAVTHKNLPALEKSILCIWIFGEYSGALFEGETAFRQALDLLLGTPLLGADQDDKLIGFLQAGLGLLSARRGKLDNGRALAKEGLTRLRQVKPGNIEHEAFALYCLGFVAFYQSRYTEAQQLGQESVALFSETGNRWGEVLALMLVGTSAQWGGRPAKAETSLHACLTICEEIGEQIERGYANQNLALIAIARGEYAAAKQLLTEDVETRREFDDSLGLADTLRNLSKLAVAQGEYKQAETCARKSLNVFEELGTGWIVESRLGYLGTALRLQGDLEEAERLYQKSLAAAKTARHRRYQAMSLSQLGCLAYDRQDYTQAECLQQEALDIWKELDHEPEMASVLRYLGHVSVAAGESGQQRTRDRFSQSLYLAVKHELAPVALDVFVGLAGFMGRAGETGSAIELLALAEYHTAGTYATRKNAHRGLAKLAAGLSSSVVELARTQSKMLDWQTAARHVIETL